LITHFITHFHIDSSGALSGGICCSVTHAAVCPVDVVKTRMQLDPGRYKSLLSGMRSVAATEGVGALATGLGATAAGYFVQGWFKFGGVEFFKINIAQALGEEKAWNNRTAIYLGSSAAAEVIADIFLCPLEATRIRAVSNPSFPQSLPAGFMHVVKNEGFLRFYDGIVPILFKQVPYTMAKFAVQGKAAEAMYTVVGKRPEEIKGALSLGISLGSGVIAGIVAAIISHPADTLLSKINKAGAGGEGSMFKRLTVIASEMGFVKLCITGLGARCVMVGALTAGQFGIFDTVMNALGATRYHFHPPASKDGKGGH
jgi:solute carrier family 25 phosphate transporter 3